MATATRAIKCATDDAVSATAVTSAAATTDIGIEPATAAVAAKRERTTSAVDAYSGNELGVGALLYQETSRRESGNGQLK